MVMDLFVSNQQTVVGECVVQTGTAQHVVVFGIRRRNLPKELVMPAEQETAWITERTWVTFDRCLFAVVHFFGGARRVEKKRGRADRILPQNVLSA